LRGTGAGPFLYTLTLVDVATSWVSCAGLRDKRAQTVLAALRTLHEGLPFRILGLDSDSGSEFLNAPLVKYCAANRITFTRARPYRKNDSCFVELCGYPHNSIYADSGIMPISAWTRNWSRVQTVGIIPGFPGGRRPLMGVVAHRGGVLVVHS
jgi:Integrase core domain